MARSVHPHPDSEFGTPIKYDPDFNGPLGRRSCTDILCLLLFIVFIICWVGIGIFAITQGDADLMLVPRDSEGRRCGHDAQVLDKPYLFFIDIMKCAKPEVIITGCKTPQVCLAKCPDSTYIYKKDHYVPDKIICAGDKPKNEGEFATRDDCAKWYIPTVSVFKRCVFVDFPAKYLGLDANETRVLKNRVAVGLSWLSLYVQNAISRLTDNKNVQQIFALITEDLLQSWWKILLGFAAAIVFCLIYIILMRWIAAVMVWFSIIGVIALLSFGCYQSAVKYKYLLDNPAQSKNANSELNAVENLKQQKNLWLALLIISAILLAVCLLVLIFLRKRIIIAIALIKEGSKAVSTVTSALFFPVVPWLLQILLVAYAITVGLYLTSVGTPEYQVQGMDDKCACPGFKNKDSCDAREFMYKCSQVFKAASCSDATCSLSGIQKPVHVKIFHAVNIIGMLWSLFFVSALGEMILAATFATWYWTFRKSDVPFFTLTTSTLRTFRYHLGTLAFGSLIITICRLIRIMIEYIDHKLRKYDNAFVNGIVCCCKCFFWCLEKFLKFINKNAYIMCAIHGKNFCLSAKDAFNLLMRNILRVFVVDKVTDMLFFLGKLLVTAIVALVAYTAFTNADFNMVDTKELHYVLVPVITIAIGTYLISSVFFGVYSMAVDTLFLCFLEDCERNDGSAEKPYFMSKELMRILGKKNKVS